MSAQCFIQWMRVRPKVTDIRVDDDAGTVVLASIVQNVVFGCPELGTKCAEREIKQKRMEEKNAWQ